jgi:aryl-alcohol dehydrogenase-like predicted oxidoreductase
MLGRGIEKHEVPRCVEEGLGLIPYCPLAQGCYPKNTSTAK